jgi:hypothetical protein
MSVQNGYGFVHYPLTPEGIQSALTAVNSLHQVTINQITFDCSISNQLNQILSNMDKTKNRRVVNNQDPGMQFAGGGNSHPRNFQMNPPNNFGVDYGTISNNNMPPRGFQSSSFQHQPAPRGYPVYEKQQFVPNPHIPEFRPSNFANSFPNNKSQENYSNYFHGAGDFDSNIPDTREEHESLRSSFEGQVQHRQFATIPSRSSFHSDSSITHSGVEHGLNELNPAAPGDSFLPQATEGQMTTVEESNHYTVIPPESGTPTMQQESKLKDPALANNGYSMWSY